MGMPLPCRLVTLIGRDDHWDSTECRLSRGSRIVPSITDREMAKATVPLRVVDRLERHEVSLFSVVPEDHACLRLSTRRDSA